MMVRSLTDDEAQAPLWVMVMVGLQELLMLFLPVTASQMEVSKLPA